MAKITGLRLNLRGMNKVMRSYQRRLDLIGEQIAADAPGNYAYVPAPHRYTARGFVQPADVETSKREQQDIELLRALGRAIK